MPKCVCSVLNALVQARLASFQTFCPLISDSVSKKKRRKTCARQAFACCLPRSPIHFSIPHIPPFNRGQKGDSDRDSEEQIKSRRYPVSGCLGKLLAGLWKPLLRTSPPPALLTITPSLHYPIWLSLMTKRRPIESALQPLWRASLCVCASLSLAQSSAVQHFMPSVIQQKHMTGTFKTKRGV